MHREQHLGWMSCRCIPLSCTKTISFLSSCRSSVRHYTSKKPIQPRWRISKHLQKGAKQQRIVEASATTSTKYKQDDERVIPTELGEEVSKSYLEYALSVILGRAIPDARDGLKPVHRRILYGMYRLGLVSEGPFRKCARVVGEVLGKYHPHGDSAVYDALVRMAQNFVMRICLVDGHGNFGSVDHDPPAAMRYTECRLSSFAQMALLGDLDKNTVSSIPNFDNSDWEPQVLPAKVPNLLLNGSSGIAVGMATSIPPHHLGELCNGLLALIDNPHISIEQLTEYIQGPDFPTGGIIMGTHGIETFYKTGHGSIVMRAKTHVETQKDGIRSHRQAIIVDELPYGVNKAAMVSHIAEMVQSKRLENISDIRDESDRDGTRVVIEVKKGADPELVLYQLYKLSALQTSFAGNMLALVDNRPRRMTLKEYLQTFLQFRVQIVRKRCEYELTKAKERKHLLDGFLLVLSCLDQVIALIRSAPDSTIAKSVLMGRKDTLEYNKKHKLSFELSEKQAEAILSMQLRRLTQLEWQRVEMEAKQLTCEIEDLQDILQKEQRVYDIIADELKTCASRFSHPRKTIISTEQGDILETKTVPNEKSLIVLTSKNFIKRMSFADFESQRRGTKGKAGITLREDETVKFLNACYGHDTLLISCKQGRMYSIPAYRIPLESRISRGSALAMLLDEDCVENGISGLLSISSFSKDDFVILISKQGAIKRCSFSVFEHFNRKGKMAIRLNSSTDSLWLKRCKLNDWIVLSTRQGRVLKFQVNEKNLMETGRTSRGVRAIRLRPDDCLIDVDVISSESSQEQCHFLAVTKTGKGKRIKASEIPVRKRYQMGVVAIKFDVRRRDELVCFRVCRNEEVVLCTNTGRIVRQSIKDIPIQSRFAKGVFIQRLDRKEEMAALTIPEWD
ncbi:hypothetical protein GpartN1_g706.t1 [Galdieria partita]|uniref:DNA topoisomerase (ATP-hydrolyzing) n=1 Tax=Galdieria partita TaxID=83374 RepID=A0A9C7PQZ6_9RHOD|nr:hypothetical protein GpartN1_g706.t1 [Galdieria partita]